MADVELVYDDDCPNAPAARAQLLRAFARAGASPEWREWSSSDPEIPAHLRGRGSPTILVHGRDVAPPAVAGGASCRLYVQPDGSIAGVPSVEAIADALGGGRSGGWKLNLAMLPGIGAALLPKVACPACWPAYAGLLSSLGLGFLLDETVLLPLTSAFLAIAVFALAFRARRRRGYAPFTMGVVAAAIVLVGKFSLESDPAMFAGLALLVAASVWNGWPRRSVVAPCAACGTGKRPTTTLG